MDVFCVKAFCHSKLSPVFVSSDHSVYMGFLTIRVNSQLMAQVFFSQAINWGRKSTLVHSCLRNEENQLNKEFFFFFKLAARLSAPIWLPSACIDERFVIGQQYLKIYHPILNRINNGRLFLNVFCLIYLQTVSSLITSIDNFQNYR